MVEEVKKHEEETKKISGRPAKLSYENQILMMLEYLREYRTYYHIATSYGISESNCYKNIKKIENILIKSKSFKLKSKKELLNNQENIEAILIDATETQIQRPKKNKNCIIQAKKRSIQ